MAEVGVTRAEAALERVVERAAEKAELLAPEAGCQEAGDPRERNLANPLLLTSGAGYDAVWVVDSDGEFARSLPYRTVLPRPVMPTGDTREEPAAAPD